MIVFDQATAERLELVYPDLRARWYRLAQSFYDLHGLQLKVAQGLRTYDDQQKIYEQGRACVNGRWLPETPHEPIPAGATGKVVTWAKPGDSWHHFAAIDSCFAGSDPYLEKHSEAEKMWSEYARLAKGFGFEAGYDWPSRKQDKPHVQLRYGGMVLSQAKELYARGKLGAVWAAFDRVRGLAVGAEWSDHLLQKKLRALGVLT